MRLHRVFRATAAGGITPQEADRREAAVLAAASGCRATALPPPMPHFGGAPQPAHQPFMPIEVPTDAALDFEAQHRGPDIIGVEVFGPPGIGKSTIVHLIRNALAHEGFAFEGPAHFRSRDLRYAYRRLRESGARIEITETETTGA